MSSCDTDELIRLAKEGDGDARQQLLSRYRERLRRMIEVFLDRRLSARVDPSDVVQDTLIIAAGRLSNYLERPSIAFYPWLRQIVRDQLIRLHRQHIQAQRRSVLRETPIGWEINNSSTMQLAHRLIGSETSPSQKLSLSERQKRVTDALAKLMADDRELLLMRCVEQLAIPEIAEVLSITEEAAKSRMRRALQRLNRHLEIDR